MSQIPPGASSGWLDPYGRQQPGTPPPGYWQANDGRWYPPNPTPAAPPAAPNPAAQTQIANPIPSEPPSFGTPVPPEPAVGFNAPSQGYEPTQISPPGYSPPPNFAPPTPEPQKSRAALYGILGVVVFLFVGCSALGVVALNRAGDAVESTLDSLVTTTVAVGDGTDSTQPGEVTTTVPPTNDDETSETTARSLAGVTTSSPSGEGAGAGVGDAIGCTVANEDMLVIEVVNSSNVTQTYFFTVALFEGSERQGDTVAFVNNLRPGERTIEESFIFDQQGSRCEVVDSDAFPVESDPDHVADVSGCNITGVDAVGDVAAEVSATNSASATSDYSIQVAFVGPDGVRRGTGFATIEAVSPGQSAPTDVFTLVDDESGLTCDVVGVDRIES